MRTRRVGRAKICSSLLIFLVGCSTQSVSSDLNEQPISHESQVAQTEQRTCKKIIAQLESYLDVLEEAGFSGAVLVAQNGGVIFEEGYGLKGIDILIRAMVYLQPLSRAPLVSLFKSISNDIYSS